jgi:hypothetical protein
MQSGSHSACGYVLQLFQGSILGVSEFNESSDNQLILTDLDYSHIDSYDLYYEASMYYPDIDTYSDTVSLTLSYEVIQCLFDTDHAQEDFVVDQPEIIINQANTSLPYTITFPSFKLEEGAHSLCSSVD